MHLLIDEGERGCSELELGSSPVSSLCVVPDFVVSLVSDPVRHGPVLLDLFCQSYLLSESLDRSLNKRLVKSQCVKSRHIPFRDLLLFNI